MICFLTIMLGLLFTQKKKGPNFAQAEYKSKQSTVPYQETHVDQRFLTVSGPFAFS